MAHSPRPSIHQRLDHIEWMLRQQHVLLRFIIRQEHAEMATLDESLALVTANSGRLDSLQTYIEGLNQRILDALADENLSPATQAKIDDIFAIETADVAKIDKALNTGVPAPAPDPAPAPAPAPVPVP